MYGLLSEIHMTLPDARGDVGESSSSSMVVLGVASVELRLSLRCGLMLPIPPKRGREVG